MFSRRTSPLPLDHEAGARPLGPERTFNDVLCRSYGVVATILCLFVTVIMAILVAALSIFNNGHYATPMIRLWAWSLFRICGVRGEIEGLDNLEGLETFVLVSNHKSVFDIMAVINMMPREMRFVAKRALKQIPLVGFALGRAGNIVIDRDSGGREIRRAIEVMRSGYTICVFAEGHRYRDYRVHQFSEGAAWLGIVSELPCVPLSISGTSAIMPRGSIFVNPGGKIRMTIGKPIDTRGLRSTAHRVDLTRQLETAVAAGYRIKA
jgi:1-acyl-sn-glycerol-3-phosphate acyltransferase